jgi:hypothetical protein
MIFIYVVLVKQFSQEENYKTGCENSNEYRRNYGR